MGSPFEGWGRLLSHHGPQEAHHSYRIRWRRWEVALCARCLALYPTLIAVVILEAELGRLFSWYRWFISASLITPAVIDWSRSRLFGAPGSNRTRSVTGALAGLGLGLAFSDYFQDSNPTWFWVLMGVLAVLILLVWSRRPVR